MSQAAVTADPSPRTYRADSFALGLLVMVGITIVQRGVGFGRGILFCRWMEDDALGRWAMAFGFLTLAVPMLLFGLPGTLTRYVELYRRSGQLNRYLIHVGAATLAIIALAIGGVLCFSSQVSWLVFGATLDFSVIVALSVTLVAQVAFNFVSELVSALRKMRVVSLMQLTHSLLFTLFGCFVLLTDAGFAALLLSFAGGGALACLIGIVYLVGHWHSISRPRTERAQPAIWSRVLPYAIAVWFMNVLVNSFEFSDRYMILHFAPGGAEASQGLVGQYQSALLIPMLLTSLAALLSGTLLPYLAADWEADRRESACQLLRRVLLGVAFVFTAFGATALTLGPWIFETLFQGRYAAGHAVLAPACTYYCWAALAFVAQSYLWCAEKGRSITSVLVVCILLNVVLNALMLPRFGLNGAVWATLCSNLVMFVGILVVMRHHGFVLDVNCIWLVLLPATLLAGPVAAAIALVLLPFLSASVRRELAAGFCYVEQAVEARFGPRYRWMSQMSSRID